MENPSTALLTEKFSKHLDDALCTRLEEYQSPHASLEKVPLLPSVTPTGLLRLPFEIRLQIYYYYIPRKRVIEVSMPSFHIAWLYEVNHTIDVKDALSFDSEEDALDMEKPLSYGENTRELKGDMVTLEDHSPDLDDNYCNRNKNNNSIFLISKQLSEEALDILYGDNIFKLELHGEGGYYLKKNFTESNRQRMRYLLLTTQPICLLYQLRKAPDNGLWSSILPNLKELRIITEQPVNDSSYYSASLPQEIDRWANWTRPFL